MVSTVLIVEDDLTFSTMLKTWLGKKEFDVETASTSARARKILLSKEFDLVISDLRLPDQDGINLLSWLREQKKNTPFIIMTGCRNPKCRTMYEIRSNRLYIQTHTTG